MRDLMNNINPKRGLSPQVQTNSDTAFTSEILDTRGLKSATFVLLTGDITDANVTFAVVFSESDDSGMSGSNAIDDANLLGTEALMTPLFSDDNKCFKLGFIDTKRYIQGVITPSGNNSGAIAIAGVWITEPEIRPAANPPT